MKQSFVRSNLDGLEDIARGVAKTYRARVGVLGSNAARGDGSSLTNAEIGIIQQFGSISAGIPPRDWLLLPFTLRRRELVQAMASSSAKAAFAARDFQKLFAILGVAAEVLVQEGFETSGFGHWPPNRPSTIARKGSDKPLIDTSQLRRSVTSDVVKAGGAPGLATISV